MTLRPCLRCGEPTGRTHCDDCRPPVEPARANGPRRRIGTYAYDRRWRTLSAAARKLQPWCIDCGAREDLTADHVIPVDERPDLAHDIDNIAVRCRPCNSAKGATVTDADRAAVLAAIAARLARHGRRTRHAERTA